MTPEHGPASHSPLWWSDVDGDGDHDVLALVGTGRPVLLVQESAGVFTDATAARGLEGLDGVTLVGWRDLDGDGRADLYLGGAGQSPRLWRNVGALFEPLDGTGLEHGEVDRRIAFGDLDGDALEDLLVETDAGTLVYRNLGDWRFEGVELPLDEAGLVWTIDAAGGGAPVLPPEALDDTGAALPGPAASTPDAGPSTEVMNPPAILPGGEIPAASAGTTSPEPILITCLPSMQDQASSGCVMASSLPTLGMLYPLGPELNVDGATGYVGVNTTTPLYRVHVVEPTGTAIFGQGALTGVRGDANLGGGSGGRYGGYFTASGGSNNVGVFGQSSIGAFGNGTAIGALGTSGSSVGVGVKGQVTSASGSTIGVLGEVASTSGAAVRGHATATSGNPTGVTGISGSSAGAGVLGVISQGTYPILGGNAVAGFTSAAGTTGVYGESNGTNGTGVRGFAGGPGTTIGVDGEADSDGGIGVQGTSNGSLGVGVQGTSSDGPGVWGTTSSLNVLSPGGVRGEAHAPWGVGVRGACSDLTIGVGVDGATATQGTGVTGESHNNDDPDSNGPDSPWAWLDGAGVLGIDHGGTGTGASFGTYGVVGINRSNHGGGVRGESDNIGVVGASYDTAFTAADNPAGVEGSYLGGTSQDIPGVRGISQPAPNWGLGGEFKGGYIGVEGRAELGGVGSRTGGLFSAFGGSINNYGVYAQASSGSGNNYGIWALGSTYAGDFSGNVRVNGTLSKSAGAFRIDHPLDPENRWLQHSFVESPDMMNVYNGNVVLGRDGSAWVDMPEWFEALNQEFRYQLTALGAPCPMLHVAQEIRDNRFRIAGGVAGVKVSWQVTGIRHDRYAEAHPIEVEVDKKPEERGFYAHPELYGQPAERGLDAALHRREKPQEVHTRSPEDLEALRAARGLVHASRSIDREPARPGSEGADRPRQER